MRNQMCSGLVASLFALALTACGGGGGGASIDDIIDRIIANIEARLMDDSENIDDMSSGGNTGKSTDTTPVVVSDFEFRLCDNPREDRLNNCQPIALRSDILTATATGISTQGFTDFDIAPTICTQNGCLDQNQATPNPINDGYAYYIGQVGETLYSYAGVLSTTNVGRPLPVLTEPVASWRGEWSLNEALPDRNDPADDFQLRINYRTRQFGGAGVKVIGGEAHTISVSGSYNAAGVMLNGQADLTRGGLIYQGVMIGLIGQERAVGAFHSSDPRLGFAGGFVANPPSR